MPNTDISDIRHELEETLVQQFRLLQEMLALTQKERDSLLNESDLILQIVEDKEVLLDRMHVIEDKRHRAVDEIAIVLALPLENISIQQLLPHLNSDSARRLRNLSEGITNLADQVQELNRANQALALSKLEWLKATQSFLISIFQPTSSDYSNQKLTKKNQPPPTGMGVEFRA